jgi:hypothetical protein
MIKNFNSMPSFLKMLTVMGCFVLLWTVATIFQNKISVFGRYISISDWWSSGAGIFVSVVGIVMSGSAVLMLHHSRYGRPLHILGWVGISTAVPFVGYVTGNELEAQTFVANMVLSGFVTLYLYGNSAVRHYFRHADG